MPDKKQVQPLYFQCLNCVFKNLYDLIAGGIDTKTVECIRKYYVSNLHGGIREHILKLAVLKDMNRIQVLLQMINVLIDSSVTYLCPVSGPEFLLADHYSTLVNHLVKRESVGLKSLYIRVVYERQKIKEEEAVAKANKLFYSLLTKGLAKNLTVLALEGCCDNEVLRLLGQNCVHLTKLDVTNSWFVNDNGCKNLCLKNPDLIQDVCEGETYTPQLLLDLMSMEVENFNPCCFTLRDVRIQDTNTSDRTVLMLLIFIKNLKTLGGFIYFRSVGDNIVYLSKSVKQRLNLNLLELYDTHLTDFKLTHLAAVLPNLTNIYTRSIHLPNLITRFKQLTDITIDFDFKVYEIAFFFFLVNSGNQLRKITLLDQCGFFDLPNILELCPNLMEFNGHVTANTTEKNFTHSHLVKARIRTIKAETIEWIFNNVSNLEHLEIDLSYPVNYSSFNIDESDFENSCLKKITERKPECFNTLKCFILNAPDKRSFKQKTILKFISECKQLKLIGDLETWSVTENMVNKLRSQLKNKNLDVNILYKSGFEPNITMQSIKEFTATKFPLKLL